jgi:hypothetical protein
LCLTKRCYDSLRKRTISTMQFFNCKFCMWLWKTNINYRHEKRITLYYLSRIIKNSKESRKSLIASHSWIYAKTDSTTMSRKLKFSIWRLSSCDDQICSKFFFVNIHKIMIIVILHQLFKKMIMYFWFEFNFCHVMWLLIILKIAEVVY